MWYFKEYFSPNIFHQPPDDQNGLEISFGKKSNSVQRCFLLCVWNKNKNFILLVQHFMIYHLVSSLNYLLFHLTSKKENQAIHLFWRKKTSTETYVNGTDIIFFEEISIMLTADMTMSKKKKSTERQAVKRVGTIRKKTVLM
jgi:hypothetical protein